jgi:hypothetical protein
MSTNDKKNPLVQVVRKSSVAISNTSPSTGAEAKGVTPVVPVRPTTIKPAPIKVTPQPSAFARPRAMPVHVPAILSDRPMQQRFEPRVRTPRAPATRDEISALARKERVPNRIAKGELDGKMRCRIWKKLHGEESRRFDQAYTLMDSTPGLELADAFALTQSGMSAEELNARRGKAKRRDTIKAARSATESKAVDDLLAKLITKKTEVCVTLGERSVLDVITNVLPVAIEFQRSGRIEKLQMVAIATHNDWDALSAHITRDSRLAHKPTPVSRLPEKRPYSDPQVFAGTVGAPIQLTLRNGLKLDGKLKALGAFDLIVTIKRKDVIVPIHGLVSWSADVAD